MFPVLLRRPWTCPRCVQWQSQRFLRTRLVRRPPKGQNQDTNFDPDSSRHTAPIKRVRLTSKTEGISITQNASTSQTDSVVRRVEGHSEVPFSRFRAQSRRQLYEGKRAWREARGIRVRRPKSPAEVPYSQISAAPRTSRRRSTPRLLAHRPLKAGLTGSRLINSTTSLVRLRRGGSGRARKRHAVRLSDFQDGELRQIFDSSSFWRDFSTSVQRKTSTQNVGLFQNSFLTEPQGFDVFTSTTLEKATKLVRAIITASSRWDYIKIVRDLDRLSDLLCRVIDLADFVRSTHPSKAMQQAASASWGKMYEFMNILNTTTALHEQLKIAMKDDAVIKHWSEEERMVAILLERDFEKSAVELPEDRKGRFVQLSQEIGEAGTDFVDHMAPEMGELSFRPSRLAGMDPIQVRNLTRMTVARIPTTSAAAQDAVRFAHDEQVRKALYIASRTASADTIQRLETLLKKRAQLAQLSKYSSWAHLTLSEKMANNPESVENFLAALSKDNESNVELELHKLAQVKASITGTANDALHAWDREYYASKQLANISSKNRSPDCISAYFSLGTVMQGLSRLFTQLYGYRFEAHPTAPGETWNSDVRRLDVISATEGHVAVLYCDLFARAGKSPNPAHFTLRCSRKIRKDEIREAESDRNSIFSTPIQATNDGMAVSKVSNDGSIYQLPTIALICNFSRNSQADRPVLLSFSQYETLFHEMGHAIHSIIGRTSLQNVSGTRCATDFAELPSILMEHFAKDRSVLSLFARHHETDAPLPYSLLKEQLARDKHFEAIETDTQIFLSRLDQAYHSCLPLSPGFSSTATYHTIRRQSRCPPDPLGTSWQGFFSHLYGYGATYYSYLFDRVIARRIWEKVFNGGRQKGALRRRNGDHFARTILRWGGGRDPWRCLGDALGGLDGYILRRSGTSAMSLVGSWGIRGGAQMDRLRTIPWQGKGRRTGVGRSVKEKVKIEARKRVEISRRDWGRRAAGD